MFSSFLVLPVNSASYKLYPIADSYVDSTNPNSNYGSQDTLHVQLSTGTVRRAYIKFDLTSIPSGQVISSAILKLYCCAAEPSSPIEVDVYATTDSWSESTIKWNNAPSVGALVANNTAVGGTGQYWSWNITDYVYAQYIGDKIVSVVVKIPNDCVLHRDFRSKEKSGTSYDPYLEIIAVQQRSLSVSSAHDSPVPSNGLHYYNDGSSVTCSVTSPVTEGNYVWTCTGWSGTGSVPATGTDKTVTFIITSDSTITWNWQSALVQRKLTIYSAHDSPVPGVGEHYYNDGDSVTCSVTSPVTEGNMVWTCSGWSGTGSVPATGTGKTVTFTITSDSTITWNWQGTPVQCKLTVSSAHDTPIPENGPHTYDHGDSVTCSVTSPVTEGNMVWTCSGWSGTGSVPPTGTETTVTFTITEDSGITWNWEGAPVQRKLTVYSAHDSPVPGVGDHYYDHGTSVTCSVTSPVTEGNMVWTCSGWSGTGSVPLTGTETTVTFTITADSSIIWNWLGQGVERTLTVYSAHDTPVPGNGPHIYTDGDSVTCWVTSPVTEGNMVWTCSGWSGTGSVPPTGTETTVTFTITEDSGITWNWEGAPVQRKLTVYSAHDSPVPCVGDHYYDHGTSVTCSVTSPVTEGNYVWTCSGWSGTGSVPATGTGKTVTFTITSDSTITWNWQGTPVQCKLTVSSASSSHDTPVPGVGDHYYNYGDSVTCSVTSPVTEGNYVWTCTGWIGSGDVPATGSGTTVTFTITQDSSIAWHWQGTPIPPPHGVGGYSISLTKQTPTSHITVYAMLIALFGAVLILTKRKRK
jgi:hypothetical protein